MPRWVPAALLALGFAVGASVSRRGSCPPPAVAAAPPPPRTLRFSVCDGMAHQRIALAYGLQLARDAGRAAVLPLLLADGTPETDDGVERSGVPFSDFYDEEQFLRTMAAIGLRVLLRPDAPPAVASDPRRLWSPESPAHAEIGCPIFIKGAKLDAELAATVFAALMPAEPIRRAVEAADAAMRRLSPTHSYSVLHLRAEADWVAHCARWAAIRDGRARDNCLNGTETVGAELAARFYPADHPVLVVTRKAEVDPATLKSAIGSLEAHGYRPVFREDLGLRKPEGREHAALVDFELALKAEAFAGNSVSFLSSLIIVARRRARRYATWYNSGSMPLLHSTTPDLLQLPVLLTWYCGDSNGDNSTWARMAADAVTSAIDPGGARVYVLWAGRPAAGNPLAATFRSLGATIVQHTPTWGEEMYQEAQRRREVADRYSPLYASRASVISTYLRIDGPLLRELGQYNYVLYMDGDAVVLRRLALSLFPDPLPRAHLMGYEMVETFPYNAGVSLMNLPRLRTSRDAFLAWILSRKNGLLYDQPAMYGVVDQGAINQFYEADVRPLLLPARFNAKPYLGPVQDAAVAHFHGPKAADFVRFVETGSCGRFKGMCRMAMAGAACGYAEEAVRAVPRLATASDLRALARACERIGLRVKAQKGDGEA